MTSTSATGWWRRNRLWLSGAVLVVALSLGWSWWAARKDYAIKNRVYPIDVAVGGQAHFEGARWRVVQAWLQDEPDDAVRFHSDRLLRLHPQAAFLIVRFEVLADAGTTPDQLNACRGQVSDATGRVWDSYGSLPLRMRNAGGRLDHACGGGYGSLQDTDKALPGRPVQFEHTYAVPRGIPMHDLRPEIYFLVNERSPDGVFLRFEL